MLVTRVSLSINSVTQLPNKHFVITGTTNPNASVMIQAAPDLLTPFSTIGTTTADATGAFQYDDPIAAGVQKRFYRAALP